MLSNLFSISFFAAFLFISVFGNFSFAVAQVMSGSTYNIEIDSVNIGGQRSTSASYGFENTVGEIGTGKAMGASQNLYAGFQLPIFAAPSPAPAPSPSPPAGGGGSTASTGFQILDIIVQSVTQNTAFITFRTNKEATAQVPFGTSAAYGQSASQNNPQLEHSVFMQGLQPETTYHFKIRATSSVGEYIESSDYIFKTLPLAIPPEKEPPANVQNFTATPGNQQIQLQWQNPTDQDFAGVQIMRSSQFYPATPFEGLLIYNGKTESFLDTGLQNGVQYYYTAFAYDADGNFASGALASGIPFAPGVPPPAALPPEPPLVPPQFIPDSLRELSFLDFDFIQKGSKLPIINGRVEAESDIPLTIAIDYEKLPEVLKTILATLKDQEGKSFSFLLRVDEEKKRYLAILNPFASGLYPVSFTVVDYQNQGLQKVAGFLQIKEALGGQAAPGADRGFFEQLPRLILFLLLALLILLAFLSIAKIINAKNFTQLGS